MVLRIAQNLMTMLWYSAVILALVIGWSVREQRYLVAETGMGYWLGIVGGTLMLMLLIYPLRKRKTQWRYLGTVKFWFKLHMVLGVVGPVLVIFHSGYRLGSLNGRVALFSMVIVALSGQVGRYLYRRIHHGLYGEKIGFEELYQTDNNWLESLSGADSTITGLATDLSALEKQLVERHGENRSYWFMHSMRRRLKTLQKQVKRQVSNKDVIRLMTARISSLRSICGLGINEILFSYWHILHFPLFIMLVISGLTHVAVVHFY